MPWFNDFHDLGENIGFMPVSTEPIFYKKNIQSTVRKHKNDRSDASLNVDHKKCIPITWIGLPFGHKNTQPVVQY